MHVLKATGPVLLTQMIDAYRLAYPSAAEGGGGGSITVYPKAFFYPMNLTAESWETRHDAEGCAVAEAYPEAYAVHRFAQSWLSEYEEHFFRRRREEQVGGGS